MFDLDFGLLPRIVRHQIFKGMPSFVEEPLAAIEVGETLDRLKAATLLLNEMSTENEAWLNRGYLRAGLSEFRSVAQALHWDLGRRAVHSPEKSQNPLVHLVFRLRRVAVYVENATTSERTVTARLRFGDFETSADFEVLLIPEIEEYLRKEDLSKYHDRDISRICGWFDVNQKVYGAPQVLSTGILVYAQELAEAYTGRTDA